MSQHRFMYLVHPQTHTNGHYTKSMHVRHSLTLSGACGLIDLFGPKCHTGDGRDVPDVVSSLQMRSNRNVKRAQFMHKFARTSSYAFVCALYLCCRKYIYGYVYGMRGRSNECEVARARVPKTIDMRVAFHTTQRGRARTAFACEKMRISIEHVYTPRFMSPHCARITSWHQGMEGMLC